jgi:predicted alpha/beta-hydrolase family hydrolase
MAAWLDTPVGRVGFAVTEPRRDAGERRPALVLAHGAGSDMHHASLVRLGDAVARAGFVVCRFNFPYREAGRRLPDRLPTLVAAFRAVEAHVRTDPALGVSWLALGGRSLGGRVASHVAAGASAARGLVFLAFPLHPANRPGTERAAHLGAIGVPMLFVQGTRDALARWELLAPTVDALPNATLHRIDDADHALAVPKRVRPPAAVADEIHATVTGWLAGLAPRD